MNTSERHTNKYGQLFVKKAQNVRLYTPAFGQLLLSLFPDDKRVGKHILNGFTTDTIHLIEAATTVLRHSLDAKRVIRHIGEEKPERLLDLAYRIQAADTLLRRCQAIEKEMPRY